MAERILGFLEGLYPYNTALFVARDTRLHRPTISKWFERRSLPAGEALGVMIAIYGPDFLDAMLGLSLPWLRAASWHERRSQFAAEAAAYEAEMGPLLAEAGP